jgi:NTP pyrophosphatase (non-canonical NTP hydrolase)
MPRKPPTRPTPAGLRDQLRRFAAARDWQQFHTPKNLAMALSVEAAELLECFQWLTPEQSARLSTGDRRAVEEEIADVLLYLLRLSDVLGIDPLAAAGRKMRLNARKYPVALSRGSARKYSRR